MLDRSRSRRSDASMPAARRAVGALLTILLGLGCVIGLERPGMAQAAARGGSRFTPNDSEDAKDLLKNAANQARNLQWAEALDLYQRVIDRFGERVVQVPKGEPGASDSDDFVLYMDARRFCHRRIAQMPPEARAIYRNRIDTLAERWYREGAERRDDGLLHRVVDQAFCSSWGDDALELLGDLAFQDGRFDEALATYSRLVPDRADDPFVLIHPDPTVDLARVAAKKWLCHAASDSTPKPEDLAKYQQRYPGAEGKLAGRKGSYASILAEAIADDRLALPDQADGRWPTFAGALTRTRVAPGPIDVGQVQWRVELEKVSQPRPRPGRNRATGTSTTRRSNLLAFHPIVLGDQVLVCDGSAVIAYNLSDRPFGSEGEARPVSPAWRHDGEGGAPAVRATQPHSSIPRYTLTSVGQRIYARLGTGGSLTYPVSRQRNFINDSGSSSIVALDRQTQGKLLWEAKSINLKLPHRQGGRLQSVNFEGTPVADERNVYVAVTDHGQQTMLYAVCYDASSGVQKWLRYLGTAPPEIDQFQGFGMAMFAGPSPGDYRHRLLSLEGATLYYQTNYGAVIALDAESGATRWVATYPRQESNRFGQTGDRDLNPAVVADGRVMVAPSDADAIYAFDAGSGRLLWKTEPIAEDVKLSHVLGVAKGRLIVTGDRVLLFNVRDGKLAGAWPDTANKSLEGYGRGMLAGDLIYWPTHAEIQVLDQQTGLKAGPPIKLLKTYQTTGGNLVAGDGYLIVAQEDGLVVFCQNSRLIDRYRQEIARAPDHASNYYRLARAQEAVGREDVARESYLTSLRKARPDETIDGIPLEGAIRDHLFRMLMRQATQLRRDHHREESIARLEAASRFARSNVDRLQAQLMLAEVNEDASHTVEAVHVLEEVLLDARLRSLPVTADDGRRTIRADLLVTDRLAGIIRRHGRQPYAQYDRQADELLARGKKERDPHLLEEIGRDYPVASVVPDALLELGTLLESRGRLAEATRAYKRTLASAGDQRQRARALWLLAHAYDARKLYVSARDAYLELSTRYPDVRLEPDGSTISDRVELVLEREPYHRLVVGRRQPPIAPPMFRRWQVPAPTDHPIRALSAEGVIPSLETCRIVLGVGGGLRMLDAVDGATRWTADLGATADWASYLDDKLIAGGTSQVVALDLASGAIAWRYRPDAAGKEESRPDPFAPGDGPGESPAHHGQALHGFKVVKGHVFCLRGSNELIVLDGDTGVIDWSFAASVGQIDPEIWVSPDRVLLRVDRPNQLLILSVDDGRPLARTPLGESERLERPPMPIDDESVVVVLDPITIKKLDLNTGLFAWKYQESEVLPVNGPPRLVGGPGIVLLLHEGRTLIRLDPATGSKRWTRLLGLEDLSRRPSAMAYDQGYFYCISRFMSTVTLKAISLDDGTPSWTSEWTTSAEDSSWSLDVAGDHVFAYPVPPSRSRAIKMATLPVIVRRRDNGTLVQRMVFPASGKLAEDADAQEDKADEHNFPAAVTFNLDNLGAVIATPRGVWGLGTRAQSSLTESEAGAAR